MSRAVRRRRAAGLVNAFVESWHHPPKESFGLKIIRVNGCAIVQIIHGLAVRLPKSREAEGVHVRAYGCQLRGPAFHRAPARFIIMAEDANALAGEHGQGVRVDLV